MSDAPKEPLAPLLLQGHDTIERHADGVRIVLHSPYVIGGRIDIVWDAQMCMVALPYLLDALGMHYQPRAYRLEMKDE